MRTTDTLGVAPTPEAKPVNDADLELIRANISKMMAETMKIGAETSKIQAEGRYYPLVALGALIVTGIGSIAAMIAALFKLLL